MIQAGGGSIVMVSSGRGVQGDLGLPAYGASKAGLINLALNVATQYGKEGIRANSVLVGMLMTPAAKAATSPARVELSSEEQTSQLQSLMRSTSAVSCSTTNSTT